MRRFEKQENLPRIHVKLAQIIYAPLFKMREKPGVVLLLTLPSHAQLLFEAAGRRASKPVYTHIYYRCIHNVL